MVLQVGNKKEKKKVPIEAPREAANPREIRPKGNGPDPQIADPSFTGEITVGRSGPSTSLQELAARSELSSGPRVDGGRGLASTP
ncbi:hypothetical protein CEXT_445551 [Caerostris extrusa]|uniref:Uncharacterized protein n=1 Tax=Caerostris extrusa TaxID=172846 RepID=A0AAV4PS09_CAEEX|nr:hypothetical protein CEXT_445551 [Caerostris extrusa]